jgi:hypothetical protein
MTDEYFFSVSCWDGNSCHLAVKSTSLTEHFSTSARDAVTPVASKSLLKSRRPQNVLGVQHSGSQNDFGRVLRRDYRETKSSINLCLSNPSNSFLKYFNVCKHRSDILGTINLKVPTNIIPSSSQQTVAITVPAEHCTLNFFLLRPPFRSQFGDLWLPFFLSPLYTHKGRRFAGDEIERCVRGEHLDAISILRRKPRWENV